QPRSPVVVDVVSDEHLQKSDLELIRHLAALKEIRAHKRVGYAPPKVAAVSSNGMIEVVVHLEGLIDVEKEKARLAREIEKSKKERDALDKRFANAEFVAKAPPEVVTEGRANLKALAERIERLTAALQRLA